MNYSTSRTTAVVSTTPRRITIGEVAPITDPGLIDYLRRRGIPLELAKMYLGESQLSLNGAGAIPVLTFQNDKGGYSLRAEHWQQVTGPESITSIGEGKTERVAVFEGMFDYLSALVFCCRDKLASNVIVLNSTAHVEGLTELLASYGGVDLYLDNDNTGKGRTTAIDQSCKGVVNHSEKLYPQHKDFNLFLVREHLRIE